MNRVTFFIDGFNLFHSLDSEPLYHKYKWLDLAKLATCFTTKSDTITSIYYFTALASWNNEKVARHRLYIRALEVNNVVPIYGKFRRKTVRCRECHKTFSTFEEKQTDVNIAIQLLDLAHHDEYDTAVIVSGDSDLIPSIKAVRDSFPSKKIWIVIPIGRDAKELINQSDRHMRIKEMHLKSSLLPNEIDFGNGQKLTCPDKWITP